MGVTHSVVLTSCDTILVEERSVDEKLSDDLMGTMSIFETMRRLDGLSILEQRRTRGH